MYTRLIIITAGAMVVGAWTGARVPDHGAPVETMPSIWYKCAAGATLEVLGSDSRCNFPPYKSYQPLNGCAIGWRPLTDYLGGNSDVCSEDANPRNVQPRTCPRLHTRIAQAGEDLCEKIVVRAAEPPQHAVQS